MSEGVDPKFAKGLALLFLAVCACGFMIFAFCGFYSMVRAEYFPKIDPWADFATEFAAACTGCYLGLRIIGVRGLAGLAEAFRVERETGNPFAGMFD
jgi:hypothetical protein